MSSYLFESAFAHEIEDYLAFKESMGFIADSPRSWYLRDFDRYCVDNALSEFSKETVEGWVIERESRREVVHRTWLPVIRDFGRYLKATARPDAYVLSDSFNAKVARPEPYLLSQHEVDEFFRATAMPRYHEPWIWQARCFFGLMYACGLRTCEARRLKVEDVDFNKQTLDILWSKGNRSRRLYVNDEVAHMLLSCDRDNERRYGKDRPAFFMNAVGNPVTRCSAGELFSRTWDRAGLPRPSGKIQPRPYSFRHYFAYANIERWAKEGRGIDAMVPVLACYMGHTSYESTYYYVHTSPDFMAGYADVVRSLEGMLPEVGFYG